MIERDEFVEQVQLRAALKSQDEAERVTRVALETLVERLGDGANLLEPLLSQFTEPVRRSKQACETGEAFSLNEFVKRISERAGLSLTEATDYTRIVFEVLNEAIAAGAMRKLVAQLPADFELLFEAVDDQQKPLDWLPQTEIVVDETEKGIL